MNATSWFDGPRRTSLPRWLITNALVLMLIALSGGLAIAQTTDPADPVDGCTYFSETSHNLCEPFESFWNGNGGLPVFGFPKTEAEQLVNIDLNQEFLTQYFERERLEHHPANAGSPYEILLGRLGAEVLSLQSRDWTQYPKDDPSTPHYQAATGLAIAEEFYPYWSSHGLDLGESGVTFAESLGLFGYPISPAMEETNSSGDTVLTQWFERARFEFHPNNPVEFQVLLGLLGNEILEGGSGPPPPSSQVDSFAPLATYAVPGGGVAEIVSATPDGNLLAYTDSGDESIGFVDISDPADPSLDLSVPVDGEPTSVSITSDGAWAIAGVNTSVLDEGAPPEINPGLLYVIELPSGNVAGTIEIGNGPDSVATTIIDGQLYAVVAIENEPIVLDGDGNQTDDEDPGLEGDVSGPGLVQIIAIDESDLSNSTVVDVFFDETDMSEAGLYFADDPQPEYVSISDDGLAAVSLQENNGIAVIDVVSGEVDTIFSTGVVDDRPADLTEDDNISFTEVYPADVSEEDFAGSRFADAIVWSADGSTIYSADEGEFNFTGGRGWSIWSAEGDFVWDDGGAYEATAVAYGHYPEGRSENKGAEVEGITVGTYGNKIFAFVGSERGSFVGVYEMVDATTPVWVQLLPTGISPEGLLAIEERDLFVTSDEVSGTISIFEGVEGVWEGDVESPTIRSAGVDDSWAAISGIAASPGDPNILYGVPDNAMPSELYMIETGGDIADLEIVAPITIDGSQALYDLEGIAVDTSSAAPEENIGFWLANEGNAAFGEENYRPNLLVQIDAAGAVLQEVGLPEAIDSAESGLIRSNGFEGVTISSDGSSLIAAIQRQFSDDEANDGVLYTRIGVYSIADETWDFFLYPLDPTAEASNWIGLSEIINLGDDVFAVIERDKEIGGAAVLKKVYTFSLDGLSPYEGLVTADSDLSGAVIEKSELFDVLDEFAPFEKVEGLALAADGDIWAALDNDGGELKSVLVNLGPVPN